MKIKKGDVVVMTTSSKYWGLGDAAVIMFCTGNGCKADFTGCNHYYLSGRWWITDAVCKHLHPQKPEIGTKVIL